MPFIQVSSHPPLSPHRNPILFNLCYFRASSICLLDLAYSSTPQGHAGQPHTHLSRSSHSAAIQRQPKRLRCESSEQFRVRTSPTRRSHLFGGHRRVLLVFTSDFPGAQYERSSTFIRSTRSHGSYNIRLELF